MQISPTALPAIATIAAALVAGGVSFISMMVAKDQKTSEYRQNWIDSLRKDLAEYVALFVTLTSYEIMAFKESKEKGKAYVDSQQDNWIKLNNLDTCITLRLNPKEHKKLIDLLDEATHLAADTNSTSMTTDKINQLSSDITDESQLILKAEWRRVKRGEWSFFITKWGALVLAISAFVLLYIYRPVLFAPQPSPTTPAQCCELSH
ncbi:hypothetical protein [Geothrix oryzae]|nr:hypothetical protein [Geothrix oryzae]